MLFRDELKSAVLQLNSTTSSHQFEELALEIFHYQASNNLIYKEYLQHLRVQPTKMKRIDKIPCLPIDFFKYHTIVSGDALPQHIFESSGTTGQKTSQHFVADLPFYEALSLKIFEQFYGSITDYHILALLPSYLERNNSSLVYMVQSFIYKSYSQKSGFYLHDTHALLHHLRDALIEQKKANKKVLLIGVTFALLDLAESNLDLSWLADYSDTLVIMETGGMKGRRKELIREDVHRILTQKWGISVIHSEYGMTELLSQGYSQGHGLFQSAPSMRILLREVNDPFTYLPNFAIGEREIKERKRSKTGGINVIDLGNIDSCSFIETQDLGAYSPDYQSFRILGRFDHSDVRGCNLMVI